MLNIGQKNGVIWIILLTIIIICMIYVKIIKNEVSTTDVSLLESSILTGRLIGPLPQDDGPLIQELRSRYLIQPSTKPYNLMKDKNDTKSLNYNFYRYHITTWKYQNKLLRELFNTRPSGFFVEAGAMDGEYLSNTLYLETELGWKGLLVEPDSDLFQGLQTRNRKSWTIHCCLSSKPYPYQSSLVKIAKTFKRNGAGYWGVYSRGYNVIVGDNTRELETRLKQGYPLYEAVQCFPLQTLLWAVNVTHVDLISLDVEDTEEDIINNFPFDQITVDVWMLEHRHTNNLMQTHDQTDYKFIKTFEDRGYFVYGVSNHSPRDYTFVRRNSSLFEALNIT